VLIDGLLVTSGALPSSIPIKDLSEFMLDNGLKDQQTTDVRLID